MLDIYDKGFISLTNRYLTWKICNFHSLPISVGTEIRCPQFVYAGSRYTLVIWPRGKKGRDPEEWFGICLYKDDGPISNDTVEFSIVNGFGKIKTCEVECSEYNIFRQERFIQWSEFHALGPKITPNGCLTIVCRLPIKDPVERPIQSDNSVGMLKHPMNDPPVKYQSAEYHSPNPELMMSALKLENSEMRASSLGIPAFDCGSPSTINSFFSGPTLENSFEYVSNSTEIENPDFNIPYDAATVASGNTLWECFTRRLSRSSKKNRPDVVALDPATDIPENATSQLIDDSSTILPEIVNSAENSNASDATFSHSATACSLQPGQGDSCSNSSSQTVHSADKYVEGTESQRRVQFHINRFQENMPTSSGNLIAGSSVAAVHCPKGLRTLSQNLKNLYLNGKDFDLRIIMENKEFKVLRVILKNRSPVFDKLLSEDINNIININPFGDCDSSVFHDFLLYIYSGEVENLSYKNIYGLYSAACKFELPELKEECVDFLKTALSIETITDIARSLNSDSGLLEIVIIFLAKNLETIMDTDEWKQFLREEPDKAIACQLKAIKIGYTKTIV